MLRSARKSSTTRRAPCSRWCALRSGLPWEPALGRTSLLLGNSGDHPKATGKCSSGGRPFGSQLLCSARGRRAGSHRCRGRIPPDCQEVKRWLEVANSVHSCLVPQKSALVEALAFKLRVLLDAEDAAARGGQPAEQGEAALSAAAEAPPSAEQAEGSPAEGSPAEEAAPAAEAASSPAEDSTAPTPAAGTSASKIEEAYRYAQSLIGQRRARPKLRCRHR